MTPRLLPALLLLSCAPDTGGGDLVARTTDPGRVTLHRLNRAEYDRTVHDLLGTTLQPARDFPDDDFAAGFDNMADALSLSPLHLELYEQAAFAILEDVLGQGPTPSQLWSWEAEGDEVTPSIGGAYGDSAWNLWSNGSLDTVWNAPAEGRYEIRVRAFGHQAGDALPHLVAQIGTETVISVGVAALQAAPGLYTGEVWLPAGAHVVSVGFTNDYWVEGPPAQDRNLIVDAFEIEGPVDAVWDPPATRARILTCEPPTTEARACARTILAAQLPRAWRRPIQPDEIERLMGLYDATTALGGDWEEGLRTALAAMLVSPHFLFRVEIDPDPHDPTPRELDGYELATRLSYFLWSTMPDADLFRLAASGELLDDATLTLQVGRMLADPKAEALIENFAGQWLQIRAVDDVFPDYAVYPDFDAALQSAMKEEMHLMARDILLGDRSMRDLLTAKDSWMDGRLARHYGRDDVLGYFGHLRVDLTGHPRAGITTTAGWLTVNAYPTRSSPIRRGKTVLSNLLCETPPPPPAEIPPLSESELEGLSQREQMELHRADPVCASCHRMMDPIGFAYEHYDGIGAYRTEDADGLPIDATGTLPDGVGFTDALDLLRPLSFSPKYSKCVTQKTFTYALGRPPVIEDIPALSTIEARFVRNDLRFTDLVLAIVLSEPFRYRRGEPAEVTP